MKEQLKALWQLCFHDDPRFVDLYFSTKYTDRDSLALTQDGQPVAALQMLPYPMTYAGQEIPTAYISGACTHPDYRNQGLMRRLLTQAFGQMHADGRLLTTLIPAEPWLFDYYATCGYATTFHRRTRLFHPTSGPTSIGRLSATDRLTPDILRYIRQALRARPCCIQHDEADLDVILADMRISDGTLYLLHTPTDTLCAVAFAYPADDGSLLIRELLADTPRQARDLLQAICDATGLPSLTLSLPATPNAPHAFPLGMARIINAPAMLRLHAATHPETSTVFTLADPLLPANNGTYRLHAGQCTRLAQPTGPTLSIDQLTTRLLLPQQPLMSLMLD